MRAIEHFGVRIGVSYSRKLPYRTCRSIRTAWGFRVLHSSVLEFVGRCGKGSCSTGLVKADDPSALGPVGQVPEPAFKGLRALGFEQEGEV